MHATGMRSVVTGLAIAGLFMLGGIGAAAQEATPAAGGTGDDHPAHIHVGTCDNLDPNPTYPLTDVTLPPNAAGAATGDAAAIPVERSDTTVDAALDKLQSGGYAINVHKSAADIGTYIACGNLGGTIDTSMNADQGGVLAVGLHELNNSGHSGIAVLVARGDKTDVHVYLAQGLMGAAGAVAAASAAPAAAGTATANATTVDIMNIAYNPAQITIPVGTTVTWTNSDPVPHTVTAQDRSLLQSGTIDPGKSFSHTFDKAGTVDYFCEFHANMHGTIVVQ